MVVPILVGEVMRAPVVTVTETTPMATLARRLQTTDGGAVVVLRDGDPVGVVTRTDVLGPLAAGEDPSDLVAADVMSRPVVTVTPDVPILEGAETLHDHGVDQALVVADEVLVGLLRTADLAPYLPEWTMVPPEVGPERSARDWEFGYEDATAPGVSVGDVVRFGKSISEREVELFAEISGDENRLHLDESFAEGTRFGRRIVHGALAASLVSAALSRLPGLVIYLSQQFSYEAPVDLGDRVTARCEVIDDLGNGRFRLKVAAVDADGTEVISGEATILVDPLPTAETGNAEGTA